MTTLSLIHEVREPLDAALPSAAVVLVHGWLGNEKVMWAFERAMPPAALVVSVRAPFAAQGGFGWDRPGETTSFDSGVAVLRDFVTRLPAERPVDSGRVILVGFSQGAAAVLTLALSDPGLLIGAASLAGFLPEGARRWLAPGRLAGKPIFFAHGTEDPTVSLAQAEAARDTLAACGATITFCTDPTGHKVGPQGMRALKAWLAERV